MVRALAALVVLIGAGSGPLMGAEISAPSLVRQADLPHGMGAVRRLSCHVAGDRDEVDQVLIAVALVPGTFQAHLLDQSPTFPVGTRTVALSRTLLSRAVIALNAGYFTPQFQPAGLCRIAGRELSPLAPTGVLSGVVAIDVMGALQLPTRASALADFPTAVQAGPFLIDPGGALGVRAHPARARRSVIASDDHGRILLLATGALTLFQVATILHDQSALLGMERVERALNLDGGPSTGLSLALDDPAWSITESGPVRNVLVFTATAE